MLFSVSHVPENKMPEPLEHALPFFYWGLNKKSPHSFDLPWCGVRYPLENDHLYLMSFPMKNGGSFHSKLLVYLRVIIMDQ